MPEGSFRAGDGVFLWSGGLWVESISRLIDSGVDIAQPFSLGILPRRFRGQGRWKAKEVRCILLVFARGGEGKAKIWVIRS